MNRSQKVALLAVCLNVAGCFAGEPATMLGCRENSDCKAGEICFENGCNAICDLQADCAATEVCSAGICVSPTAGDPPTIQSVTGNGVGGGVLDGMLIEGTFLARADFEIQRGVDSFPLTARALTETSAEVTFQPDILSGDYTLVVTNQSGSSQQAITLTLPDMTGDMILTKINTAVGTLAPSLIPTHGHDTSYYGRTEVDALLAGDALLGALNTASGTIDPSLLPINAGSGGEGGNYLPNADFSRGLMGWSEWWDASTSGGALNLADTPTGVAGSLALENTSGTILYGTSDLMLQADPGRTYRIEASFKRSLEGAATGRVILAARAIGSNGLDIVGDGLFWFHAVDVALNDYGWHHYAAVFGAGTANPLPAAARQISVAFILNDNAGSAGGRVYQVQGLGLFDVSSLLGNTNVMGALTVAGTSSFAGAVSAGNQLSVGGNLTVTGSTSTGSTNVAGTLGVSGNTSSGSLNVTGSSTLSGTVTTGSNVNMGGALTVGGSSTLNGDLTLNGGLTNVTLDATLLGSSSATGSVRTLGNYRFCALAAHSFVSQTSTTRYCEITRTTGTWYLYARGETGARTACKAVCF